MEQKIEFSILTKNHESLHDLVARGDAAKVFRDHPVVLKALSDMYQKWTLAEDTLFSDKYTEEQRIELMTRYSMMRALLTDFVTIMDDYIADGHVADQTIKAENSQ